MRRGDIYWVDLEPARGGEIRKIRPGIIISNDLAAARMNRVQIVPLSTNIARIYPSEAVIEVEGRKVKAIADQIRTVAKERLGNYVGTLSARDMIAVEQAVRLQLGLR
jgi:mRNA interferase MazF